MSLDSEHPQRVRRALLTAVMAAVLAAVPAQAQPAHAARAAAQRVAAARQMHKTCRRAPRSAACRRARLRVRALSSDVTAARRSAPALRASGASLRWPRVADVVRYVLATTVPGRATTYSLVTGTSVTPEPVPGATVSYSVRSSVTGSRWARPEAKITFGDDGSVTGARVAAPVAAAAAGAPSAATAPTLPGPPASAPAPDGFRVGLVSGSDTANETRYLASLHAPVVRVTFAIGASAASLADTIAGHAANGTRVILEADFSRRMPTAGEARNLASWAAAYGPGGTFWAGRSDGALAVREIEFGNETNMTWQYGDTPTAASYAERARTYALRLADAQVAVSAANSAVGLLAQGDDGDTGYSTWVDQMYAAVPDLASRVMGWTVHPYGPSWSARLDRMLAQQAAHGADKLPVYVTEFGLATDDGRCLSDNYGFDRCMTYATAASTLDAAVSGMRAKLGARLRAVTLYCGHDLAPAGASSDREMYFGVVKQDLSDKGAFTQRVRALLTAA